MYKACVFDLDGTLANTIDTIAYYGNLSLSNFGMEKIGTQKYKYMVGSGYKSLIHQMISEAGASDEEFFSRMAEFYIEVYNKDPLYLTTPYDGTSEMLSALNDEKMMTAVLSNKPHSSVSGVLSSLFGDFQFSLYMGNKENMPLKPDPSLMEGIMSELGVKPEECLYVGDTITDMETGKRAGVFTIGVLWGFRDLEELKTGGADLIVSHPSQITEYIRKSNRS